MNINIDSEIETIAQAFEGKEFRAAVVAALKALVEKINNGGE